MNRPGGRALGERAGGFGLSVVGKLFVQIAESLVILGEEGAELLFDHRGIAGDGETDRVGRVRRLQVQGQPGKDIGDGIGRPFDGIAFESGVDVDDGVLRGDLLLHPQLRGDVPGHCKTVVLTGLGRCELKTVLRTGVENRGLEVELGVVDLVPQGFQSHPGGVDGEGLLVFTLPLGNRQGRGGERVVQSRLPAVSRPGFGYRRLPDNDGVFANLSASRGGGGQDVVVGNGDLSGGEFIGIRECGGSAFQGGELCVQSL